MPTLLQRIAALAGGDEEVHSNWRAAYSFARQLSDSQEHSFGDGTSRRILPEGGLAAAATFGDEALRELLDFLVLVYQTYRDAE